MSVPGVLLNEESAREAAKAEVGDIIAGLMGGEMEDTGGAGLESPDGKGGIPYGLSFVKFWIYGKKLLASCLYQRKMHMRIYMHIEKPSYRRRVLWFPLLLDLALRAHGRRHNGIDVVHERVFPQQL